MKKKTYKIDTQFYFSILVCYQELFDYDDSRVIDKISKINAATAKKFNIEDVYASWDKITGKRVQDLLNCTGAALFKKGAARYFTRTSDVYQLLVPFGNLLKYIETIGLPPIRLRTVLEKNLKKYSNTDKAVLFATQLEKDNFLSYFYPKELRNITWFVTNHGKSYRSGIEK